MVFSPILERDIVNALTPINFLEEKSKWLDSSKDYCPVFYYDRRKIRKLFDRVKKTKEALCALTTNNKVGEIYSIINSRKKELYNLALFLDTCLRKDLPLSADDIYNKQMVNYELNLIGCIKENGVEGFLKSFGCPDRMRREIDSIIEQDFNNFESCFSEKEIESLKNEMVDAKEIRDYLSVSLSRVDNLENFEGLMLKERKKKPFAKISIVKNRSLKKVEFFPSSMGAFNFTILVPKYLHLSKLELLELTSFAEKYFSAYFSVLSRIVDFRGNFKNVEEFLALVPVLAHSLDYLTLKALRVFNSVSIRGSEAFIKTDKQEASVKVLSGDNFISAFEDFYEKLLLEGKSEESASDEAFDLAVSLFLGQKDTSADLGYIASFGNGELEGLVTTLRIMALKKIRGYEYNKVLKFATMRSDEISNRLF